VSVGCARLKRKINPPPPPRSSIQTGGVNTANGGSPSDCFVADPRRRQATFGQYPAVPRRAHAAPCDAGGVARLIVDLPPPCFTAAAAGEGGASSGLTPSYSVIADLTGLFSPPPTPKTTTGDLLREASSHPSQGVREHRRSRSSSARERDAQQGRLLFPPLSLVPFACVCIPPVAWTVARHRPRDLICCGPPPCALSPRAADAADADAAAQATDKGCSQGSQSRARG
jgi:hypothetical protein